LRAAANLETKNAPHNDRNSIVKDVLQSR